MSNRMTARALLLLGAFALIVILLCAVILRAGGPKHVAGTSYFDASVVGYPLVWPQGLITYYTDQGDLSPILPNASANNFVAAAFEPWTSVSTAAITAIHAGSLVEDVNGSNVYLNADGSISMPADIQPTAIGTPVGIVYDYDGSVTNALMGGGAGDPSQCFFNAVFGGNDSFGNFATYQHAVIVINGLCAQQSAQLNDVKYRLMRVIGSVLGLGWSQLNPNVLTGSPHPTADDLAGFPLMHFTDPWNCVPITLCYPSPFQLSTDDAAALSRLYPVTAQNLSSFPGKQVFSTATARIHGSVFFTDTNGNPTQPMQGVNVVARWIDPTTGMASRRYAASSVSGFRFTGNAGNPVTGFNDVLGDPLSKWGSSDLSVEGSFDLAGLPLPNGASARYQLSVEALDPTWAAGVGPYSPGPVAPSGSFVPLFLTVTAGGDVQQNIFMTRSAPPISQAESTWANPVAVAQSGDWVGSFNEYGDTNYVSLAAQGNRTLSVAVTALDETGSASQVKTQPVIGMWPASDPQGTAPPAYTTSPFNQVVPGITRLDVQVGTSGNFLIGIADFRGDGRPDYHYHAQVLYADSIFPSRIGVNGGTVMVQGVGLAPGLNATIGNAAAPQLAAMAGQLLLAAAAHIDGPQDITITDPVSGASSIMTGAPTYGAAASDNIVLVGNGLNPATPVGTQATNAIHVRVLQSDGMTPVSGATVGWSASNGVQLSACGGASSCSMATDQSGYAITWLTPAVAGTATITATLAPGVYSPAKSVTVSLYATESAADIGVSPVYLSISQGANTSVPLTARVLSNGVPQSNATVNFTITSGAGTLSAGSAQTNTAGYSTVALSVTQFSAQVKVSACVAPANAPCQLIYVNPVPLASQILQPVSGGGQVSAGQPFQAIIVRVTDGSTPPNPVLGADVAFVTTVLRPGGDFPVIGDGETTTGNPAMPVILQVSQATGTTDIIGIVSIVPSAGGLSPPLEVDVNVSAASGLSLDFPLALLPGSNSGTADPPPVRLLPPRIRLPVGLRVSEAQPARKPALSEAQPVPRTRVSQRQAARQRPKSLEP